MDAAGCWCYSICRLCHTTSPTPVPGTATPVLSYTGGTLHGNVSGSALLPPSQGSTHQMEANREAAEKCRALARRYLSEGNAAKCHQLSDKAERLAGGSMAGWACSRSQMRPSGSRSRAMRGICSSISRRQKLTLKLSLQKLRVHAKRARDPGQQGREDGW